MEWNGNVEQTSKANQDDRYLQTAQEGKNTPSSEAGRAIVQKLRKRVIQVLASTVPDCYFLGVVDEEVGLAVDVRDEEGEHDVDSEEPVDDVVHDERGPGQVPQERELQRAYPRRVHHQEDQKYLPDPASQQKINKFGS